MDEVLGIVVKDGEVVMRRRDPETGYIYDEPYYDDLDDEYQLDKEDEAYYNACVDINH